MLAVARSDTNAVMASNRVLVGLVGWVLLCGAGGAAVAGPPARPLRTVEGISEYALGNGLRVLLFADPSSTKVTVNVVYEVGSRHEGYGETGMAHLLEHMMFKGTPRHPKVAEELDRRGASFGASTWPDRTGYHTTLNATGDNLAWALEMEADRMVHASLAQKELSAEFSVVQNEIERTENRPDKILAERMLSTAYLWHAYGKTTHGSRHDIERITAGPLRAFYQTYYRPDNATLIVTGKLDPGATLQLIDQTLGRVPRPSAPLPVDHTVEPVQDGEREVTLRRVGDVAIVSVLYHVVAGAHPDFAAADAIARVLTDDPSGRLYRALVKTGLATKVDGEAWSLRDPGVVSFTAIVKSGQPIAPVRERMIAIVEGLARSPVTAEEIARYRARVRKELRLDTSDSERIAIVLTEAIAAGDWRLFFLARDRAEKVDAAQIQRVAGSYLVESNRTVGTFMPTPAPVRAPFAERPAVAAMVDGYQGRAAAASAESFEASIANIEQRTRRIRLPSGMQLALLPKDTRGDVVKAVLTLRFGAEKDFRGQVAAAELLGRMLMRGTRTHRFEELEDAWDRLESRVKLSSAPGVLRVDITSVRDTLPAVLDLVHEVLTQPSFPAAELDVLKKKRISSLEEQRSDPDKLADSALWRALRPWPKDDVRYRPTIDEGIARLRAVQLAQVKKLYRLLGTSDATMAIVGDFDAAAAEAQVTRLLGGWKSPRPYRRLEDRHFDVAGAELTLDTPDKDNAVILAGLSLPLRDDHPDVPALTIVDYVLGGAFSSRLTARLRQKDGISYMTRSRFDADPRDPVGVFIAQAILAPQNAARGWRSMLEEIERLVRDGLGAAELAGAKKAYLEDFALALTDDGNVAGWLEDALAVGRTLAFYDQQNARIGALTPEQVNAAARTYLRPAALVKVTGADPKKAAP